MTANNMMITFHIEGADLPIILDTKKAAVFAQELDKAGKKWRLGNTL
jgi:hypothetical protein